MKLTNLNIDCLNNVFEYLELDDLLNVADANKQLHRAANLTYVRKYCRKQVIFEHITLSRDRDMYVTDKVISIGDFRTSLQFIRCFGRLICDVKFDSNGSEDMTCIINHECDHHVIRYVNEYCSESLIKIQMCTAVGGWEGQLRKPFSKIRRVQLENCNFTFKDSLSRLFPRMQILIVDNFYCGANSLFYNANHFPQLEKLSFILKTGYEAILPYLFLNPQLKTLQISSYQCNAITSELYSRAFARLQHLDELHFYVNHLVNNCMNNVLHLKSVKSFVIGGSDVLKIPFSFDQLNKLIIANNVQLNVAFFRFIAENPTIRNLEFKFQDLSDMDRFKLAKSLPLLESMQLGASSISADEASDFLTKFTNLQYFKFKANTNTFNDIRKRFCNEWQCEMSKYASFIHMKKVVKQQGSKRRRVTPAFSDRINSNKTKKIKLY